LRQLDPEASYLMLATRLSAVAILLPAEDLIRNLIDILEPWSDHVAVDSNAWWPDGPVSGWLAELHNAIGDDIAAREYASRALPIARGLNDVRALRRLENLRKNWKVERRSGDSIGLSVRETQVLQLLANGSTNAQIARSLSFSVSTIRDDTTSIYRKLHVKGRAEAVGKAIQLGLIAKPSD
jgi:DNA-binding CsgD family transcriptional regulator